EPHREPGASPILPWRRMTGFTPSLKCLFANHRTAVALHGGIVCGQQLSRHHPFKLVSRSDADQAGDGRIVLLVTCLLVGIFEPKRLNGLISENVVPAV